MVATIGKVQLRPPGLSFRSVWKELLAEGWQAKKPPRGSLETHFRYVQPGGDHNGKNGVDYFLGEDALLEYYVQVLDSNRSAASTPAIPVTTLPASAPPVSTATVLAISVAAVPASVPPVSTTAAPVIPVAVAPLLPASPTTVPTSSSSVTGRTYSKAKRPLRRAAIPTLPYVGSFGEDDDEDEDGAEDDSGSDDDVYLPMHGDDTAESAEDGSVEIDEEDEQVEAQGTEMLADADDDLIVTSAGEDAAEYGAMESGDEAEKNDVEEHGSDEETEDQPDQDEDEPDATPEQIESEVQFAEGFLASFSGDEQVLAGNLAADVLRSMSADGWEDVDEPDTYDYMQDPYIPVDNTTSYTGLWRGYSGPTAEALSNANSPLALFFFFLPVVLWQHIAVCSNQYHREMVPSRVDEAHRRYKLKRRGKPNLPKKTKRDIRQELENMRPIMPHELCRFVGLLVARVIMPNREKLANHWKVVDEGAISHGAFGTYLSRDRFMKVSRNLHFNPNNDPRAKTNRAWKIRKVVEVLQRTFLRGYVPPAELAFDEAMLPCRSSFNKMRVYMKDKPHKWGTKLFMLCSSVTAYCIRFEVYCGKKEHTSDAHNADMKSGPAAVVRNLLAVFGPDAKAKGMRLVVIDRFYTSVALAIQLLLMGFFSVGTIMTNRLGYCKQIIEKKKTRPVTIARGSHKIAKSKHITNMTAISWWDSRPVHFLCTGGSLLMDRVVRRDAVGVQREVPCPRVIKDYHAFMGGVNVHDQLRLQRYSIQRAVRFRKYYKSLVLGLIDMAIVNGYIVHKTYHKNKMSKPLSHLKYMKRLHIQLCQLQQADMYEGNLFGGQQAEVSSDPVPLPVSGIFSTGHRAQLVAEWRDEGKQKKRRQRTCKVCSALRELTGRASTTASFCGECRQDGPVFLCIRARRQIRGVAMTCWDIWHKEWKCGELIPAESTKPIRMRQSSSTASPTTTPRKKRRTTPTSTPN